MPGLGFSPSGLGTSRSSILPRRRYLVCFSSFSSFSFYFHFLFACLLACLVVCLVWLCLMLFSVVLGLFCLVLRGCALFDVGFGFDMLVLVCFG